MSFSRKWKIILYAKGPRDISLLLLGKQKSVRQHIVTASGNPFTIFIAQEIRVRLKWKFLKREIFTMQCVARPLSLLYVVNNLLFQFDIPYFKKWACAGDCSFLCIGEDADGTNPEHKDMNQTPCPWTKENLPTVVSLLSTHFLWLEWQRAVKEGECIPGAREVTGMPVLLVQGRSFYA